MWLSFVKFTFQIKVWMWCVICHLLHSQMSLGSWPLARVIFVYFSLFHNLLSGHIKSYICLCEACRVRNWLASFKERARERELILLFGWLPVCITLQSQHLRWANKTNSLTPIKVEAAWAKESPSLVKITYSSSSPLWSACKMCFSLSLSELWIGARHLCSICITCSIFPFLSHIPAMKNCSSSLSLLRNFTWTFNVNLCVLSCITHLKYKSHSPYFVLCM